MRSITFRCLAAAAIALATTSCGDVVRDGGSPMFLVIDNLTSGGQHYLNSDVESNSGSITDDGGIVSLRLVPRNTTNTNPILAPSTNNDVTITRYRITYRRADGRNVPGVDVPYGFDGAATGTVSVGGNLGLTIELVRHVAKAESPLRELAVNPTIITTLTEVTVFGQDRVGNDVSATGYIQINFGNFAG
jgi:hypothetical protein